MGVRPVFGMSLRSLPKTNCQSHAPEALRLRPDRLPVETDPVETDQPLFLDRSQAKLLPAVPCAGRDLAYYQNRNILLKQEPSGACCPVSLPSGRPSTTIRLLLFSTVAGGGSNPMHFEHYLSGSSAPSRSARRTRAGRHGEPSALIIDCQSVPSARVGGISSFDAFKKVFKKVNGRKRHIAVDTQGLLWGLVVHAAGDHETQWALQLLAPIASRLGRVETVFADQAYRLCRPGLPGPRRSARQGVRLDASSCRIRRGRLWIFRRPKTMDRGANLRVVRRMAPVGPRVRAADRLQRDNLQRDNDPLRHASDRTESARLKIKTDSNGRSSSRLLLRQP